MAESYIFWDQFKTRLYNDVKHKLCHMNYYQADQKILEDDVYDYSLCDLNRMLVGIKRSLVEFPFMPLPQQEWGYRISNPLLQTEQYNVDEMATLVNKQRAMFNSKQAAAFDAVLESITNNQGHIFLFILLVVVERLFFVILLLLRLEEVHLCFKISIFIHEEDFVAELKCNSYMFPVIQQTKVIM